MGSDVPRHRGLAGEEPARREVVVPQSPYRRTACASGAAIAVLGWAAQCCSTRDGGMRGSLTVSIVVLAVPRTVRIAAIGTVPGRASGSICGEALETGALQGVGRKQPSHGAVVSRRGRQWEGGHHGRDSFQLAVRTAVRVAGLAWELEDRLGESSIGGVPMHGWANGQMLGAGCLVKVLRNSRDLARDLSQPAQRCSTSMGSSAFMQPHLHTRSLDYYYLRRLLTTVTSP